MNLRVCAEPGCPELTDTPRCGEHTRQRYRQDRARTSRQRDTRTYERNRRTLLRQAHPGDPCAWCNHPLGEDPTRWSVDHIVEKWQGGTDNLDNLQVMCSKACNTAKSNTLRQQAAKGVGYTH